MARVLRMTAELGRESRFGLSLQLRKRQSLSLFKIAAKTFIIHLEFKLHPLSSLKNLNKNCVSDCIWCMSYLVEKRHPPP